jgi:membrane-associated protease RseP (regulator of RpoE activity)
MNKLPQLSVLLAITLLGVSNLQAEQSGFITPEQSEALSKANKADITVSTTVATTKPARTTTATTLGYLGIGFDKIPASIRAHLPSNITAQQGLIVTRFADNSSAADDGMKVHDVLLSYDGQAIEKPEDFIQKIRKDKPGRIVKFTLLRQGNILTIAVTMGMQKNKKTASRSVSTQAPNYQMPTGTSAPPTNFSGLAIRRIGQDIYDASIGVIGQDGKSQRRSYKGNRMQILQQIMQDKNLPAQARQQLLFAVQPKQKSSNSWGGMPNMPFGNTNGFNPNQFFKGWNW